MVKTIELQRSDWNEGMDLLIERDAGNDILILMGRTDVALNNWKRLRKKCGEAIKYLKQKQKEQKARRNTST